MKNLLILLLLTKLALLPQRATATNYYFSSTDGDDSRTTAQAQNSSTPWRSIDKLNSYFSSLQPGDVVFFKRGDVFYGSISIKKSGGSGSPIVFDAYGSGPKPIITGFASVTSWSNIGGNLWMSSSAVSNLSTLNIIAINGAFAAVGKWPTNGYNSLTQSGVGTSINHSSLTGNWTGGTVVIRKNHWILDKSTISSQSGTTINFSNPTSYTASSGWGWFIQNHQSACDAQNEWWYDASSKKIGIYSSGTPSGVQVSTIDNLVNIGSFSYLNFSNIIFQGSNAATVLISSGNNIKFESCDFQFQGINGFTVQSAAHHIVVNNCTANYTNNDFVSGGGSANWTFTNNLITNTAQVAGMGNSADGNYIALYNIGANSLIQYNVIRRTGYSGIDFRGSGISVLNNVVDTFCNVKDDGAGIYTFTGATTTTYAMRTVDRNIVLNGGGASAGTNTANYDAFGIYMDDNSSEVTITNNTVANCGGAGLFLHAGHNLTVQNNTIYNCVMTGNYGQLLHIYPGAVTTASVKNVTLTGNKIISKTSSQLVAYLKFTNVDMSQLGTWDNNYYCRPSNENTSTFQILQSSTQTTNLAGWQSSYSKDMSSKKSPKTITDVKDLRFEYNATSSNKIVNLGATYIDVTGQNYSGSITLAPYSSAVLIYVTGTVANQPPVANAGADQVFSLPTNTATLTGSGTDPDGTIASYQWTKISGPSQYTIASPTLAKTSLSNLAQGVYQFELKVTDNSGATATDMVQITVNAGSNQPPIARAGNSQSITLPVNSVSLDGTASNDPDGTIASWQWTKILGPASAIIINSTAASTTVASLTQGIYQFELRVTDNLGAVGKDTVQIMVNGAPNQPPTANAGLDINVTLPANSVNLSGSGTDDDGTIASYQWTKIAGPSQYNIVSPTQAQTSVSNLTEGTYTFELRVTDNAGASDRDTVQIVVNPGAIPNQPPTANAGLDINITLPNNSVNLSGSGTDGDGTIASYQWTKIAGPFQYSIGSPSQAVTSVNNLAQGIYQFELKVTDNSGASATDIVQVTVNAAPNQMPSADAGADINITLPTNSAMLSGSGSDPDGTIVSYQWTKLTGPAQYTIALPTRSRTTIDGLTEGFYEFQLQVTDNSGAVATDIVQVTVNGAIPQPNQNPRADAGSDVTITLPTDNVTLNGNGSDPDGNIASWQWTMVSGPSQYNITSATQARTSVNNLAEGVYEFQLQVTDNSGATDLDIVQVTVNAAAPPNQSPLANAGSDITITLPNNSVTLSGGGTDADGTIASYQWIRISGPSQYNITSPNAAQTSIDNLAQGVYAFQLQVTDNLGAVATDVVQVTVNAAANQAPSVNAGADVNITLPVNSTTLSGTGNDADGWMASYQWRKVSGPSQYNITSANTRQTSINNLTQGIYAFELIAMDNSGATGRDTVQVSVSAAPNQLPFADAGVDMNITLPTNTVTLSGIGTDPDGAIISYRWAKIAGPGQYSITSSALARTSVNNLVQGTYDFELTVTDNSGATDKDTVEVIVNAAAVQPNQAPEANAGSDIQLILPTNNARLSGRGTDADGQISSYRWRSVSGPKEFTILSPTRSQTNINNLVKGQYQFELTVTDNSGATDRDTVQVTVLAAPPNKPPTANAGADKTITLPTNSTSLSGSGSDPDGTVSSYQWRKIAGPSQSNINSSNKAQATASGLVQGIYKFELTVTDNAGATGKDTVQVTVNAGAQVNRAPTANAGLDINITLPTNSVILSGSGTDVDGTIASYKWNKISGPLDYNIVSGNQAQTTVNNLTDGTYKFELIVTDNSGATARDTIQVIVNPANLSANHSPTADAGSDLEITLPTDSIELSGKGTDVDGTVASYKWKKVSGPTQFNIASSTKAKTKVNGLVQGVYKFELTVTDNANGSGKSTVQVTVHAAPNQLPSANAGSDLYLSLPTDTITLTGTGTDPDGTIASYKWTNISGPAQPTVASPTKARTLISKLTEGIYQFEMTVADNAGAIAKDTIVVTVFRQPTSFAKVFPNPATSVINIQIEGATNTSNTALRIYDNKGNLVYQEDFVRPRQPIIKQINVSKLPGGIYFVELQTETSSITTLRFIKK